MPSLSTPLPTLDSETWAKFEGIIRDYEKALQRGQNPLLENYLPAEDAARLFLLSELIHAELEHGLKGGKAVRVESYLTRFPELRQHTQTLFALIVSEYRFRQEIEGAVSWREFAGRFPELAGRIETELATDRSVAVVPAPDTINEPGDQPSFSDPTSRHEQVAPAEGTISDAPGTRIGPYKLIRKIGQGGMGAVYLAEQEQPVRRQVALKVIRSGLNNAHVLARFEAERQSLSMMDHLNIAKVLDVGATVGRQPYFVMELVQGVPLTTYCEENTLSIRERLDLFVMVCQGIQHAHQKGVIHRDIKPSNVLVTLYENKPVPKIIDFGLAKATERSFGDESLTEYGTVLGTLDYMSPEQAEGDAQGVDTRSDIYSLGVLLYELLTGTPPLDRARLLNVGFTEILRKIKEEEPPRPSVRLADSGEQLAKIAGQRKTEPAKLVKLLRSELDWIALRALEKDRNRRYETAGGLGQDVQRYLADEPVEACPPSTRYRLGKFTRKHRTLLTTATGFVALVVLGIVGLIVGLVLVLSANARANDALLKQKVANKHTTSSLRSSLHMALDLLPNRQQVGWREKRLLGDMLKECETYAASQDESVEAREVQAEGQFGAASIRALLGQYSEAEESYLRAIELYAKLAAEFPDVVLYRDSMAKGYNQLALLQRILNKFPEADESLRHSLALHQQLADEFAENSEYKLNLAQGYYNLGLVLSDESKPEEAVAAYERAIASLDTLTAEDPDSTNYQMELARCHVSGGLVLHELGKLDEAQHSYEKAARSLERLVKEFSNNPETRLELAKCRMSLAILLTEQRKPEEAKIAYQQAITNHFWLAQQFPLFPDYQRQLARAYSNYGAFLSDHGETRAVENNYRNAILLGEQLVGQYPDVPDYKIDLAAYYGNLANFVRDQNKPSDALELYGKALATLDKLQLRGNSADVWRVRLNAYWDRALAYALLNKHVEEKEDWRHALAAADAMLNVLPTRTAAAADHYFVARAYSLASAAFKDDAKLREQYVSRAIALLHKARTLHYFQVAGRVKQMKDEPDFGPLHKEVAYKNFVAELEAGSPR